MSGVDTAIAAAMSQLGTPYVFGTEKPGTSFDCSGLTQWAYGLAGISLPRTAAEQQQATQRIANPLPGDLVFYGDPATHVGIYVGNGRMIDAPNSRSVVWVENLYGTPTFGRVRGAGTALAPVLGLAGAGVGLAGGAVDAVTSALGGARNIALQGAFVLGGVALVGVGVWRAVAPRKG